MRSARPECPSGLLHCHFNRRVGRIIARNLAFPLRLSEQFAVCARSGELDLGENVAAAAKLEAQPALCLDGISTLMTDQEDRLRLPAVFIDQALKSYEESTE